MAALRFTRAESAFYNWLAGFIDGEGCFYAAAPTVEIRYGKFATYIKAEMKISLREDDVAMLQQIKSKIGGRVTFFKKSRSASLRINSKKDTMFLMRVLDAHPLRAKKRRDYNIWRGIVLAKLMGVPASEITEELRQLRQVKEFNK